MARIVVHNNKGVTLIEMMVALGILLVVSLALMQTTLVGMRMNLQNTLRDEAVSVAETRMNQLRVLRFTNAITDPGLIATGGLVSDGTDTRNFRSFSKVYTRSLTIADLGTDSKQITVSVAWPYRGQTFTHAITTIMRRQ